MSLHTLSGQILGSSSVTPWSFLSKSFNRFTNHQSSYKICDIEGVVQELQGKTRDRGCTTFLGAFEKLRKVSIGFVMSLCPPLREHAWEQIGTHWTDLHEIWYFSIFRKSAKKAQVSLKSVKKNGCFTWRSAYTFDHTYSLYGAESSLRS